MESVKKILQNVKENLKSEFEYLQDYDNEQEIHIEQEITRQKIREIDKALYILFNIKKNTIK